MKNILPLFLIFFTVFTLNCLAQTGPGGVGITNGTSDLIIWYRSDYGVSITSSNVDSWENAAGYTDHDLVYTGSGTQPTLTTTSVNGYDEVRFYNSGFLYTTASNLTTSNFVTNTASSFMATNIVSRTSPYTYGTYPLNQNRFSSHIPWGNNNTYYDIGQCCGTAARIQVNQTLSSYYNYSIWSYGADAASGKQLYRNGTLLQSRANTSTFNRHTLSKFQIGQRYNGNISELVVFKTKINTAQRLIIQNYISAKYNISLTANDLYTQDNSGNGNFDHDVAGIGQATDGTNHTDSRGTGIVQINTPSTLSNGDYLFWGEETKDPSYAFVSDATNYTEQLSSRWRVSKVNDLGTVTVAFDITGMDLSGKQSCQPLQLVVDNNSDFSSPTAYDLTITGTTATATGILFTDSDYFTLRYLDQIVWNGTSFFNGSGAANAPNNTNECLIYRKIRSYRYTNI